MTTQFTGGCQCGAVRYQISGAPLNLFVCHCTQCQKQSASAFGMALWIKDPHVQIVGELKHCVRVTPGGRRMRCSFCSECGSRLLHQFQDRCDVISIKPGTLDNTRWLNPVGHICTKSAQSWVAIPDDMLCYAKNPPTFAPLIAKMQRLLNLGK